MTSNPIILEDLENIYNSDLDWNRFHNTTVLVSGANGFLPAYIVESLLYLNHVNPDFNVRVLALVRNLGNARVRFAEYTQDEHLEFIIQDVCDAIRFTGDVDFIIHAASQASPKYYGVDPVGTLKANVLGTLNLLEYAREKNVSSFLYFSSGEVYGEVGHTHPIVELGFGYIDPMEVRSCYAESKRMGENICVSFFQQYKVPVKIVRPFHTYGPKMKLDDGRVYADFVSNILNNQNIHLKSDGKAERAFCYLSDATIGFLKVLLEGEPGNAYNVGNPNEQYSILELANIVSKIYPERGIDVVFSGDQRDEMYLKSPLKVNSPDITKIKKLNWRPQVNVEVGFRRTIESYI